MATSPRRIVPPPRRSPDAGIEDWMAMNAIARPGALSKEVAAARQRNSLAAVNNLYTGIPNHDDHSTSSAFGVAVPVDYDIGPFDEIDPGPGINLFATGQYGQSGNGLADRLQMGHNNQQITALPTQYNAGRTQFLSDPFAQPSTTALPQMYGDGEPAPSPGGMSGDGYSDDEEEDHCFLPEVNPHPDLHDEGTVTSYEDFRRLINQFILNITPRNRSKSLLSQSMYDDILHVHHHPQDTTKKTAQFRFWARKQFQLIQFGKDQILCHREKPVAVREQIYEVLIHCHEMAGHGGRDKTSHEVRRFYSWIPKEIISKFVAHCPSCQRKKPGGVKNLSNMSNSRVFFQDIQADSNQPRAPGMVSLLEAKAAARAIGHQPYTRTKRPSQTVDEGNGVGKSVSSVKKNKREPKLKSQRKSTYPANHISYNDASLYELPHPLDAPGPSGMPILQRSQSAYGIPLPYNPLTGGNAGYYAQLNRSQSMSYASVQNGMTYRDDDPANSFAEMVQAASARSNSVCGYPSGMTALDSQSRMGQMPEMNVNGLHLAAHNLAVDDSISARGRQQSVQSQGGMSMMGDDPNISMTLHADGSVDNQAFIGSYGVPSVYEPPTGQYPLDWSYMNNTHMDSHAVHPNAGPSFPGHSVDPAGPSSYQPQSEAPSTSQQHQIIQGWDDQTHSNRPFDSTKDYVYDDHPEFDLSLLDIPITSDLTASINEPGVSQGGLYQGEVGVGVGVDGEMGEIDPMLRYDFGEADYTQLGQEGEVGEYHMNTFGEVFEATMEMLAEEEELGLNGDEESDVQGLGGNDVEVGGGGH